MPPCTACARAGPQAASECQFPRRGDKDIDREFRRRPVEDKGATLAPVLNPVVFGTQPFPPASRPTVTPTLPAPTLPPPQQLGRMVSGSTPWTSPPGSSGQLSPQTIGTVFSSPSRTLAYPTPASTDNILPPTDEVVEGCRVFVTTYFQLGFIPKATFLDNLRTNPGSVSRFLLACILSISARFTKTLVRRYGSARKATDHFLQVARSMVPTEMYNPSLERIQAFFLLAISQWGNDDRDRSSMDMGVAVRMAALLKLHCEESYALPPNCPADRVVRSESARRVFWMIQSQENLHSGYKTPAPFPLEDITTLLPCDERDFAFGHIPNERAAEAGTPPALANPELVNSPNRCLFATLIQAHGLWGRVARKACRNDNAINKVPPWSLDSELQTTIIELGRWEGLLPEEHTFSVWNLSAWKHQSLHLAYLSVTMVLRLTHIVARRVYLHDMLATLTNEQLDQSLESTTPTMANANENFSSTSHPTPASTPCGTLGTAPQYFWEKTSEELFDNVSKLHDQINEYFKIKSSDEGFPQILVFCVYMCGSLSSFLWRYPTLCPRFGSRGNGEMMARRCLEVLSALHAAWPTSSNWQKGLQAEQQIATPLTGVSPAEEQDTSTPGALSQQKQPASNAARIFEMSNLPFHDQGNTSNAYQIPRTMERRPTVPEGMLEELINVLPQANGNLARLGSMQMNTSTNELLDAELAAFLQGDFQYDLWDGWGHPGVTN